MRAYTLGYLKQRLAFRLTNSATVPTQLDAELAHAIDTALRQLVMSTDAPAFRKDGSFSTVSGQTDYSLDEDFVRMIDPGMRINTSPYYPLRPWTEQDAARHYEVDTVTARPLRYSIVGRDEADGLFTLRLRPTPDAVYPITYRYYSYPASLENAADTVQLDLRFPSECVEGLLAKAAMLFPTYQDRDTLALARDEVQRVTTVLNRTKEVITGMPLQGRNNRHGMGMSGVAYPEAINITPYTA